MAGLASSIYPKTIGLRLAVSSRGRRLGQAMTGEPAAPRISGQVP